MVAGDLVVGGVHRIGCQVALEGDLPGGAFTEVNGKVGGADAGADAHGIGIGIIEAKCPSRAGSVVGGAGAVEVVPGVGGVDHFKLAPGIAAGVDGEIETAGQAEGSGVGGPVGCAAREGIDLGENQVAGTAAVTKEAHRLGLAGRPADPEADSHGDSFAAAVFKGDVVSAAMPLDKAVGCVHKIDDTLVILIEGGGGCRLDNDGYHYARQGEFAVSGCQHAGLVCA